MACCLIVGAAPSEHKGLDYILEHGALDCVIAVDGGYAALMARNREPDVIAGDFDSLGFVPPHAQTPFDTHKDFTDLDWALQYAHEHEYDDVILVDALSGRLDHSLGNLDLMVHMTACGMRVWGITDSEVVLALLAPGEYSSVCFAPGGKGVVSVMPHSDVQCGVTETGFEYGLDHADQTNMCLWGISNELIGHEACVSLEAGSVWVFAPLESLGLIRYGKEKICAPGKYDSLHASENNQGL